MQTVIVAGGGAAGLAAAITAAENGASVMVLEQAEKAGRKISLSGNGRCNLSNLADPPLRYSGSDPERAEKLLANGRKELFSFFERCGILIRRIGDGIYPYSEEASSVTAAFLRRADALGVTIRCNTTAESAVFSDGRFTVGTKGWHYEADRLILAGGSTAFGGPEGIISLAASFGHTAEPFRPSLVPLLLKGNGFSAWAGARARGKVTLLIDREEVLSDEGQLQFTSYGISGIPVMNISGTAVREMARGRAVGISLDLAPDFSERELEAFLTQKADLQNSTDPGKCLSGILPERLAKVILSLPAPVFTWGEIAHRIKHAVFSVSSSRPLSDAQCASGGIPLSETDPDTMESGKQKGLYLAGEMLDVDGRCGGYNLSFAFLSGIAAGRSAAK